MESTWRRLLARLSDGPPEARREAVVAILRASFCGITAALLLPDPSRLAPGLVSLALSLASLGVAALVAGAPTVEAAQRYGRWSTVADLAIWSGFALAFSSRPGATAMYGAFVVAVGPLRYGLRGLLVTTLPVVCVSLLLRPTDSAGEELNAAQVVLMNLAFSLPPIAIRGVVARGITRLRLAEQQFATAFEHASIGMALTDIDLQVLQCNRSLGVLLGESAADLLHARLDAAVDRLDRPRLQAALQGLSAASPSTRLEVRLRRPDGGLRWGHVSASLLLGVDGEPSRVVVQVENITERKRSEAMLSHAAAHDALTDLPNRNLLLARLDAALHRGEQVGVLFLDLDRFKVVNDGLGHAAGDLLLVQVAIRLRDVMRPDDMVARIGGDEFVVLCRNADVDVAHAVTDRVLHVLNQPITTAAGGEVVIGASVGIAMAGPGDAAETALRDADTAMYAAKAAGGGRGHVFSPELRDAVVRTHELEVDLRAAIRADELTLVYQPVLDVTLGRVISCEALLRWEHAARGEVPPQEFCSVAEQSDLILELGDWVLRRAAADAAGWPDQPGSGAPPTVAVNVSLRQLLSSGFPDRVQRILDGASLPAGRLCLEVTETVLAGDVEPVVEALQALRALGLTLAIDDFGTGHASLTYLARFPVDHVKVDRSFVAGLGKDAGSAAIVGGVVAMAHTFDMRVVAEGVETYEQFGALRELGCDAVQGFLLSRPRTAAELDVVLHRSLGATALPGPRREDDELRVLQGPGDEARRYRLLVEGAKEVTGRLDLDAVLEHAFAALGRAVTFTGGSILLVEDGEVRIAAALPAPTPEALAARIPLGQGVSGSIAQTGEPRYLPDITIASAVTSKRRASSSSSGVRSWYGVPLIAEGRPIGVLQVDSTELDAFGDADRLAVLSFAPVVALAVVCARRSEAQLRALQEGL